MDLDELKSLVNANTKMIVVNFPHNPTGFLPSQTDFSQLVEIARRHNLWLFCDEMYRGLELTAAPLPSATDVYEKSVVLCGLSKAHGLPGLRSGWLVIKDKPLREKLMNWKHYTTICPPAPSERLALCALKASDHIIGTNRMLVKQNLQFAAPFFKRWQQWFEWRPPQAGSTAFVKVNVASAAKYCHHLAQTAGVLLLPGSCMWDNDQFVRFGFGRKNFQAALAAYDRFLETNGLNQNA